MKQSHLFAKTIRNISDDVKSVSHKLLLRGGFIFPVSAGIYALSPLGFRVFEKIKNIIRNDFDQFEAQEISMPIVHPARIWKQTGRFQDIGDELWKIKNREGEDFVLAMTHEEIAAYIAETIIKTYKDLPILVNQFQVKIRDELRARGGMLRAKEFLMQDAYSFDKDEKGMDESYEKFYESYGRIFKNLSLEAVPVEASGGVMGQGQSHEFMLISEAGEDKIAFCEQCGYKANIEVLANAKICQKCKIELKETSAVELGQTFKLGLKYSRSLNVKFKDSNGKDNIVYMGSYGIGIGRAMAAVAEIHNDEKGLVWPQALSPFAAHLISLGQNKESDRVYTALLKSGIDVLYDDRLDKTPGEKFTDADLMGMPFRIVISAKTAVNKKAEVKKRNENKVSIVSYAELNNILQ
ncbi:MAG: hypothetical protein US76_00400 [Parcubacteria group bacterium GW2011_GWA2_38_13b]|nr:MAG: hypothetical protein US76_00400 [Parcubacteria group bacterium GW2011_GWA2_38_13b]